MNINYVSAALGFHGQPMQKIWEDEYGGGDLQRIGVLHPNYAIYQDRQKYFTFQDRAKRLKLHQFLARKANDLYDKQLHVDVPELTEVNAHMAVLPPYEVFVSKQQDKAKRYRCILEAIKQGDIVYGVVKNNMPIAGAPMAIRPICTAEPLVRYLSDIPLKTFVHRSNMCPLPLDKAGNPRNFQQNDIVCCEVLEISVDADRLNLGMEGVVAKNKNVKLGLITPRDLPKYYRTYKSNESTCEKYEEHLLSAKEFQNPNYDVLYEINGLNVSDTFTMMSSLKHPFPPQDYARELRQTQASKWAFRAVAEGIEHFKIGKHVEAFQCLNKALNIDPRNVEGLVARGALYANKGSFLKAVEDFEKALKLNEFHVNARKYMGETLVALGRSYEEDNRIQDAINAYNDCLKIIPNHEQARLSLDCLQQKPGSNLFDIFSLPESAIESGRSKKKKHQRGTASSSSSSADDSSSSASESDAHSSGSERAHKRDASLSPLSKRMALHAASLGIADGSKAKAQPFNQPFFMAGSKLNANEFKLDDDDTEKRVRKLLQDASKHKKEKTKKSKKKKTKKVKKDKKEKASKATPSAPVSLLDDVNFQEAYKVISGLNMESKLNENMQMYEKTLAEIQKRQQAIQQQTATPASGTISQRALSDSPPPKAPSMRLLPDEDDDANCPAPPKFNTNKAAVATTATSAGAAVAATLALSYQSYPNAKASTSAIGVMPPTSLPTPAQQQQQQQRFSFQIRRPVKVDKFGLVRIATPLTNTNNSPSLSPRRRRSSRSSSRSRSRSRGRSYGRRRRSSRSRSASYGRRRRGRRSPRSRSRSRSTSRRRNTRFDRSRDDVRSSGAGRSFSSNIGRNGRQTGDRREESATARDRRHRSRSRDNANNQRRRNNSRSPTDRDRSKAGNRVGPTNNGRDKSPHSKGPGPGAKGAKQPASSRSDGRWQHDKFDDGPSIEEIDEIINQAQKQRKQEIISRDKNILKKL